MQYIVYSSLIYGFWLPLWYLQTISCLILTYIVIFIRTTFHLYLNLFFSVKWISFVIENDTL
jgi:hypothetical protein